MAAATPPPVWRCPESIGYPHVRTLHVEPDLEEDKEAKEGPLEGARGDEPVRDVLMEVVGAIQEGGLDLLAGDFVAPPQEVVPVHIEAAREDQPGDVLAEFAEVGVGESDAVTTIMSVLRTP